MYDSSDSWIKDHIYHHYCIHQHLPGVFARTWILSEVLTLGGTIISENLLSSSITRTLYPACTLAMITIIIITETMQSTILINYINDCIAKHYVEYTSYWWIRA